MMKLFSTLLFILLISTTTISNGQDENNTDNTDYLAHAESSERLSKIMRRFFSLIYEEGIEETTELTENDMTDLIENAEELLFYAELMAAKVPATELEETESVIFSAMASKLYNETLNIQQLATSYDFNVVDSQQDNIFNDAFERLNRTCAACHQLFRDGDLISE
jgi:hypothetical protein